MKKFSVYLHPNNQPASFLFEVLTLNPAEVVRILEVVSGGKDFTLEESGSSYSQKEIAKAVKKALESFD